jgi:2-methylcitrate dehydratase PrpD
MTSLTEELAGWAARLEFDAVPPRVRRLACSQVLSQLAAIRAGQAHPLGGSLMRAFGAPLQDDARRSACVLAGLGSWLNLDDTAYAGHLSNSTVAAALAFARAGGLTGAELLTAVVTANECAARVTASATLGPFRGQTAVQTTLVGGVAGRLRCEGAPPRQWVDSLGLALSMPPWTLLRGFAGSDARVLSAFTPMRMAMDACDGAAAGLAGATDILEHPDGFLARFAAVPLPEAAVLGLGERWHTDTLSFKVRPGGPGIDAAVDCGIEISAELVGLAADDVAEVAVDTSLYTMYVSRVADGYVRGPGTPASVLPLSLPYTVSTALLYGDLAVADFARPAVDDDRRWRLAGKVRLAEDARMTRDLLVCEAPFGEAISQAGQRAHDWLRQFGGPQAVELLGQPRPPVKNFEESTKHTGARVTVRLVDGRSISRQRDIPVGAAGPDTRARHAELVRAKYLAVGGSEQVADACAGLGGASAADVAALLRAALGAAPGIG